MMTKTIQTEDKAGTEIKNPATGETLGYSSTHTIEDLKEIINKARTVQKDWENTPLRFRIRCIKKISDYLLQNMDRISHIISQDNGKTSMDALTTEVLPSIMYVHYFCNNAKKYLKEKKISSSNLFFIHKRSKVVRVPWGVIGIIGPWNFPFSIPFFEVIVGLLAGNAVILKIATETQWVGKTLEESMAAAELPEGLFNHVNIPGRLIGDGLLENNIDKLFFTGSVAVGKKLMAKAAETLTPVSLELGGNDAMIVCEDANLYRAASGVLWAGFQNCGQSCGGVERVYVQEAVYEPFLKILKNGVHSLQPELGLNPDSDMGVMTTQDQMVIVQAQIADALDKGAKVHAKSPATDPKLLNAIPAMVLTNVDHSMQVMCEETFGPLVGVMKYKKIEEAIKLANDSTLGLTASIWSKNRKKAEKIGRLLEVGVITINDHLMSHGMPETPWGGFKDSGIGRCHGEIGFDEMTQPQVIVKDLLDFTNKNPWWHPYNSKVYDGIKGIVELLFAKKILTRIWGFTRFIKIFPRMFVIDRSLKRD